MQWSSIYRPVAVLRLLGLALAILWLAPVGAARAQTGDLADANRRVFERFQASDFAGSLAWSEKALAIAERDYGARSTEAAFAHVTVAIQNQSLSRFAVAEAHYRQGLAIQQRLVAPDDPSLAGFVSGLGLLLYGEGRYDDAEPLIRQSVRLQEIVARRTGDDVGLAAALYSLGTLYTSMTRLDDGNRLLKRSLAIFERHMPGGSLQIALVLNNLATNRQIANDYAPAIDYQQRAEAQLRKFSPGNVAGLAKSSNNLGFMLEKSGSFDKAAEHYREALARFAGVYPDGHPDVATTSANYGTLLLSLGRPGEAEPLLVSALAMRRRWLPADHPDIALAHGALADLWIRRGDWRRAAAELEAAAAIHIARAGRQDTGLGNSAANDIGQNAFTFTKLVKTTYRLAPSAAGPAFVAAQRANASAAAASLAQMSLRSAKGDPRLAALVRTRQDLVATWNELDRSLVAALSNASQPASAGEQLRRRIADADARIKALDRDIAARFPDFASLTNPAPLAIAEVRAELHADEALVLFLDTPAHQGMPEETFVWVVTPAGERWLRADLGSAALAREVAALRCGLDYDGSWAASGSPCRELTGVAYTEKDHFAGKALPFDVARAHALYRALLAPAADLIRGRQLLVVASGPLTKLPLQVFVTEAPKPGSADLHKVAWLVRSHAITVLPAVSSLKALRRNARPSAATEPFLGFGNPVLAGDCGATVVPATCPGERIDVAAATSGVPQERSAGRLSPATTYFRNGLADVAHLRQLCALPDTAYELRCVALSLGAPAGSLRLGPEMTETVLKRTPLDHYRVIHFATHGLLAGETAKLSAAKAEPALVMTPPAVPTDEDDGLLTASEIAGLKLDADWVVMSACNTAAAGAADAEALSGLARAFFYAGARALLVSHWPVNSDAATLLTSRTFAELRRAPGIGRSEAFRRAILSLIDDPRRPWAAHPSVWAPFVVVGEGAAPATRR